MSRNICSGSSRLEITPLFIAILDHRPDVPSIRLEAIVREGKAHLLLQSLQVQAAVLILSRALMHLVSIEVERALKRIEHGPRQIRSLLQRLAWQGEHRVDGEKRIVAQVGSDLGVRILEERSHAGRSAASATGNRNRVDGAGLQEGGCRRPFWSFLDAEPGWGPVFREMLRLVLDPDDPLNRQAVLMLKQAP